MFLFYYTVEYDFKDFFNIAQTIANSSDEDKAGFIKYSLAEMEQKFSSMFQNSSKELFENRTLLKNWFKTEVTGERREFIILATDHNSEPALYCVYCLLLCSRQYIYNLCNKGLSFNQTKRVLQTIKSHEESDYHKQAVEKYNSISMFQDVNQKEENGFVELNRYVVKKIVQAVLYVATSGN